MPLIELTPLDKVRQGGIFKYVRLGAEFRFLAIEALPNHSDAVDEGENPTSAGAIRVSSVLRTVDMIGYGSSTLDIRTSLPDDQAVIDELLWGKRTAIVHCGDLALCGLPSAHRDRSVPINEVYKDEALRSGERWCEQCLALRESQLFKR